MRGIYYMIVAIALLSCMDALAKWLMNTNVTAMQMLAIRSVVIVPLMVAVYAARNKLHTLKRSASLAIDLHRFYWCTHCCYPTRRRTTVRLSASPARQCHLLPYFCQWEVYNLCVGVVALILLPWFWLPLDVTQIVWLVALSLLAVGGHYFITMAFASDDASLVAPFEYTALIWAIMFDFVVWSTTPSATTIGGATIIVGSGLYIVHRERLQKALLPLMVS